MVYVDQSIIALDVKLGIEHLQIVLEVLNGDRYTLKALNSRRTYKYAHDRLRPMPMGHVPVEVNSSDDQEDEVCLGW